MLHLVFDGAFEDQFYFGINACLSFTVISFLLAVHRHKLILVYYCYCFRTFLPMHIFSYYCFHCHHSYS